MEKAAGRWPVEKVDPNTQKPNDEETGTQDLLPQAIIPISLLGLYHFSKVEENAKQLILPKKDKDRNWNDKLYGNHYDELAQHVADYTHTTKEYAGQALNHATNLAIRIVNDALGDKATGKKIAHVFADNRSNILTHLPATIGVGSIVEDTTIDDNTNKMEGPVSNNMHLFEEIFSN